MFALNCEYSGCFRARYNEVNLETGVQKHAIRLNIELCIRKLCHTVNRVELRIVRCEKCKLIELLLAGRST